VCVVLLTNTLSICKCGVVFEFVYVRERVQFSVYERERTVTKCLCVCVRERADVIRETERERKGHSALICVCGRENCQSVRVCEVEERESDGTSAALSKRLSPSSFGR
jgi:hypothetical protein